MDKYATTRRKRKEDTHGGFKGGGAVGLTADDWKTKAFLK